MKQCLMMDMMMMNMMMDMMMALWSVELRCEGESKDKDIASGS